MSLIRIKEYRNTCFTGKPPSMSTLYRWAEDGTIPTVRRGKLLFVDLDQVGTGMPLVDNVLRG